MNTKNSPHEELSPKQYTELLNILKIRFEANQNRHTNLHWNTVQKRLDIKPYKLWSLQEMERTGGQPDIIGQDSKTGEYIFCDCAPETPKDRTSLCYDDTALTARKEHKPEGSALGAAENMGIEILTEKEYYELQQLGEFDTKTSSWIKTPDSIRSLGGAIFCDRRYGRTFTYHNGAESYYKSRGFRGCIRV